MIVRRYATCSPPKFPCVPRIFIFAFSPFYLTLINGLLLLLLWERETRRLTNRMNEWYSNRKEDGGYRLIQDLRHRVKGRFVDIEFDSIKIEKFIENDWFSTSGRDSKKSYSLIEKFFDCCSTAEFGQQLLFKKKRKKKRTLHGNHWETNEYNILRMHVSARVTA